jgi:hypothetical protein
VIHLEQYIPSRIFLNRNATVQVFYFNLKNDHGYIFFIGVVRGGVQLGPLGTTVINRPIVPAQGDYDDGEIG